jgi:CheY-like chemotaxis protein
MAVKVLIVDDDRDVLESTGMLVRSMGVEPVTLTDPSLIVETVEREQPALILQDLRMPDLNVSGVVAALRSNPATADVPLVFFSANADLPTTAARYDVWGYLAKPFSPQELAHLLERALAAHPDAGALTDRDLQREIRDAFHEYWNALAALNTYASLLTRDAELPPRLKRAATGLDEALLRLESHTDRLRSYLLSLAILPPEPHQEPKPPKEAKARPAPRGHAAG